jgi:hypothetical protein
MPGCATADLGRPLAQALRGLRGITGAIPRGEHCTRSSGFEYRSGQRVLRYLPEPGVQAVLDRTQQAAIERICARLPELVPPMPPC